MLGDICKMVQQKVPDSPSTMEAPIQPYTDQFPLWGIQKQEALALQASANKPHRNQQENLWHSFSRTPSLTESSMIRRKLPTPSFSLGWEREDWNICLVFRLFKRLSKGLKGQKLALPKYKCWMEWLPMGTSENKTNSLN